MAVLEAAVELFNNKVRRHTCVSVEDARSVIFDGIGLMP